jgi:hypothetical protein
LWWVSWACSHSNSEPQTPQIPDPSQAT